MALTGGRCTCGYGWMAPSADMSRATRTSSTRPDAYSCDSACASSYGGWKPTPSHSWVCAFHRSLPTSKSQARMPSS